MKCCACGVYTARSAPRSDIAHRPASPTPVAAQSLLAGFRKYQRLFLRPIMLNVAQRPIQQQEMHSQNSLERCSSFLAKESHLLQAPAVLLAYLTDVPRHQWMLGLGAANRDIPLVLIGQGLQWAGPVGKLWGIARAAQLLSRVIPTTPIIVLDGIDTFAANAISAAALEKMQIVGHSTDRVLLSTECNLWPGCHRKHTFTTDVAQHRACTKSGAGSCFPNGGAYVAGSRVLARFAALLLAQYPKTKDPHWMVANDQYILHSVYLQQRQHNLSIDVDGEGAVFLSLIPCQYQRVRRAQNCFDTAWNPVVHVQANETTRDTVFTWRGRTNTDPPLRQTPLILHTNADPTYARWNLPQLRPAWSHLVPPSERLLQHRTLLLDSASRGLCGAMPLGELLLLGHNRSGRPWSAKSFSGHAAARAGPQSAHTF